MSDPVIARDEGASGRGWLRWLWARLACSFRCEGVYILPWFGMVDQPPCPRCGRRRYIG